ncbi:MAG TPA: enoyl-CoA hydratase/isomerase family protein [Acidimicrobiales bacterium]|nr:enoyl-CoA hydratase/isomerase family protein [Acidimicrobiales bacterium]
MHLSDGELDELLCSAFAEDELARSGDVVVVVASPDGASVRSGALERLASLPCVVIGEGHSVVAPPPHLDVVSEDAVAGVDRLLAAIEAKPIATVTLVMLLHGAHSRSLGDGLVAESSAYSLLQAGPEFGRWLAARGRRERPESTEPPVLVHREGHRFDITLNRPHVRNALNRSMRDALLGALAVPAADPTVTEVRLQGAGPVFCSGGDLDEFGSFDDPANAHVVRLATSIGRAIDAVRDRVIVHMHGRCAGSGVELPAFAGRVVAAADTSFSLPEVGLGLIPGAGGTVSLTRRIGRRRVALLALSGASIDAPTALAWGLVDGISP